MIFGFSSLFNQTPKRADVESEISRRRNQINVEDERAARNFKPQVANGNGSGSGGGGLNGNLQARPGEYFRDDPPPPLPHHTGRVDYYQNNRDSL